MQTSNVTMLSKTQLAFNESAAAKILDSFEKELAKKKLTLPQLAAIQQAARIGISQHGRIKAYEDEGHRQKLNAHAIVATFLDEDPVTPDKRNLTGFLCSTSPTYLQLMERRFPLGIYERRVNKAHFNSTGYSMGYSDPHFNWVSALSILMAQTLTEQMPGAHVCLPVALPTRRGLLTGHAAPAPAGYYGPAQMNFGLFDRTQMAKLIRETRFDSPPEYIIVIDSFLATQSFSPAEEQIQFFFDELYKDRSFTDTAFANSRTFFSGGQERETLIAQAVGAPVPSKTYKDCNTAKQRLADFMASWPWEAFSKAVAQYTPAPAVNGPHLQIMPKLDAA